MKKLFLFFTILTSNILVATDLTNLLEAISQQDIEKVKLELSLNQNITTTERGTLLKAAFRATEKAKQNLPFKDHMKAMFGTICYQFGAMSAFITTLMFTLAVMSKDGSTALKGLIPATITLGFFASGYRILKNAGILLIKAKEIEDLIIKIEPVKI